MTARTWSSARVNYAGRFLILKRKRSTEQISYTMSRIRSKDTSIELTLRKALWASGLRYRKNYNKLPGTPDIVFIRARVAIFCDSSFWHGRDWSKRKKKIYSNKDYWLPKIEKNIARDKRITHELMEAGWVVLRFWDIEIEKELSRCLAEISTVIKSR